MKPLTLFGLLVLAAMVHSVPANSKDQEMETEQIATLDDTADTGTFTFRLFQNPLGWC